MRRWRRPESRTQTSFRFDDPIWHLFRPPWAWGCRCVFTAVSIREAARKGIQEAIDWLASGVPPGVPAWVPMPPFQPDPAFDRSGVELSTLTDDLDPEIYPPAEVELWSRVIAWELAGDETGASRHVQRQVTRGPRKGQIGWYDSHAGKFMPKDWTPHEKKAKAVPAVKAAKPTVDEAHAHIKELLAKGETPTVDQTKILAEGLTKLTAAQLGELKVRLGLKASGPKAEFARKLAERALAVHRPPGQTEPAKAAPAAAKPPEKPVELAPAAAPPPPAKPPAAPPPAPAASVPNLTPPPGSKVVAKHDGLITVAERDGSQTTLIDPAHGDRILAETAPDVASVLEDVPLYKPLTLDAPTVADGIQEAHKKRTGKDLSYGDAMHVVESMKRHRLIELHKLNERQRLSPEELSRSLQDKGRLYHYVLPGKGQPTGKQALEKWVGEKIGERGRKVAALEQETAAAVARRASLEGRE